MLFIRMASWYLLGVDDRNALCVATEKKKKKGCFYFQTNLSSACGQVIEIAGHDLIFFSTLTCCA